MDTQDEDDDEEETNEEIADIEKWSEYVEKYCNGSETMKDDIKNELLNRPVFLTRNAHILKQKYENALQAKNGQSHSNDKQPNSEAINLKSENKEKDEVVVKQEEGGDSKKTTMLDDVSIQDNSVYKFQANSYKMLYSGNTTSVLYRRNAFKKARKVRFFCYIRFFF